MTSNRLINTVIGLSIGVVLLLGWFLGASPILDQFTAAQAQTQSMAAANAASEARLAGLKKQFANIAALQSQLDTLRVSVPSDAAIPGFLAEINALCAQTGVTLRSLTVNNALTYVAPSAKPTPADPAASPSPTPSAPSTVETTPTAPADASSKLVAIPVKVVVAGQYGQVMAFAGALQSGPRLLLVTTLTLTGTTADGSFSGAIDGNVYALPMPAGVAAASGAPTPTPTPTPSATPSPAPTSTSTGSPTPSSTPIR